MTTQLNSPSHQRGDRAGTLQILLLVGSRPRWDPLPNLETGKRHEPFNTPPDALSASCPGMPPSLAKGGEWGGP